MVIESMGIDEVNSRENIYRKKKQTWDRTFVYVHINGYDRDDDSIKNTEEQLGRKRDQNIQQFIVVNRDNAAKSRRMRIEKK